MEFAEEYLIDHTETDSSVGAHRADTLSPLSGTLQMALEYVLVDFRIYPWHSEAYTDEE